MALRRKIVNPDEGLQGCSAAELLFKLTGLVIRAFGVVAAVKLGPVENVISELKLFEKLALEVVRQIFGPRNIFVVFSRLQSGCLDLGICPRRAEFLQELCGIPRREFNPPND